MDEELEMKVVIINKLVENTHHYPDFSINLITYTCAFIKATIVLTDHDKFEWVSPDKIKKLDLADADIPLLKFI